MVFPEALKPGDTIGLAAPAFPVTQEKRDAGVRLLERMGYHVAVGECLRQLYNCHGYLAGDAKARARDLNSMFGDPQIKAIFCVRGGYGSAHIMKYLDYDLIRENPKIFVGYSDLTNLHSALNKLCGLVTFHGPMVVSNMLHPDFPGYSRESLFRAFEMKPGEEVEFLNPPEGPAIGALRPGKAQGVITGGNLSLVTGSIGTFYQPDTRGKVLFLEDIEESIPRLDMYITHLEYAGMMEQAAAVVLGNFEGCDNSRYDGTYTLEEFLRDRFKDYRIPVLYRVASDHSRPMGTIPMGAVCRVDADGGRLFFSV